MTSQKSFLNAKACLNFTIFKFTFRLNGILLKGAGNSKPHTKQIDICLFWIKEVASVLSRMTLCFEFLIFVLS